MATTTLKGLSEALHRELKERAVRHHRSLNREILVCLETSVRCAPIDVETLMARARVLRQQVSSRLTDRKLHLLKNWGRS